MGFDPRSPGSHPGPKAGTKPLCHPGIPSLFPYSPTLGTLLCVLPLEHFSPESCLASSFIFKSLLKSPNLSMPTLMSFMYLHGVSTHHHLEPPETPKQYRDLQKSHWPGDTKLARWSSIPPQSDLPVTGEKDTSTNFAKCDSCFSRCCPEEKALTLSRTVKEYFTVNVMFS